MERVAIHCTQWGIGRGAARTGSRQMRIIAGDGDYEMHSNNDYNSSESHNYEKNLLEPCFTIFEVEPYVNHISHQIWLTRELFAETRSERGVGRSRISTKGGGKCDEEKIGDRIVSAESNT
jgi:hypothetical protein